MRAFASATWRGTWKTGSGTISTDSPVLKAVPFSFASRFEGASGASPEELLAAAHAGCFNQALANNIGMIGLEAERIETKASVEVSIGEKDRPTIVGIRLVVDAKVPDASLAQFNECAEHARANCSIARALKCCIEMEARLA